MSHRVHRSYLLLVIIIASACLLAGCLSDQKAIITASPDTPAQATLIAVVTPGIMQPTKQSLNLSINENAELHAANLSVLFSVRDKNRDPVKQTVTFELSVQNVGNVTVAELQKKLSELYAVDRFGNQYSVPTHVALMGLRPGEIRSGTIEIANVPDQALPGLVFHYQFGSEEASWVIFPETTV